MSESTNWICKSCESEYWSSKNACPKCGGDVVINTDDMEHDFSSFMESLSIPQFVVILLATGLITTFVMLLVSAWYLGFI